MDKVLSIAPIVNLPPIKLLYVESYFDIGNTSAPIGSDMLKFSITLTDGMDAVCKDRLYRLSVGDMEVFSTSEIHFAHIRRSGIHRFLDIYFPTEFLDSFSFDTEKIRRIFYDDSRERSNRIVADRSRVASIGEKIVSLIDSDSPLRDLEIFESIIRLLITAAANYKREAINYALMPKVASNAILYIEKHYLEEISLEDISKSLGCSITYLTSTFKKSTGKTVMNYLTELRLEDAKKHLLAGASVTDTCFDSGFTDCSAFIKTFKKHIGVTPLKFKRSSQEQIL